MQGVQQLQRALPDYDDKPVISALIFCAKRIFRARVSTRRAMNGTMRSTNSALKAQGRSIL